MVGSIRHTVSSRGGPSRRKVLKGIAAVGATGIAAPVVRRARAADPLYVNTWGGPWEEAAQEHIIKPFMEQTGVEVRTVSPVSFAKLAAQVNTGVYEFDVTTLGGGDIVRANQAGLLTPIEEAPFENALFQNGVASHAFATVIAWRTDRFPEGGPQTWQEFWDTERFPGARCLQRYAARIIPIALLADGVPIEGLYPLDVERAFASLDRIKPHIPVWWSQGGQSAQLLRDGEVDMIGIWHGRLFEIQDAGAPVAMTWNQGEVDRAYWVVAKGTPREETARRFVEFATSPKPLAGFCKQANYGPLNPQAVEFLTAADLERMPTSPQNHPRLFEQEMLDFGADPEEVTRRFEEWIAT